MLKDLILNTYCVCFDFSLGVKVPAIVKEAKTALADGHAVVIGLQTTGEVCLQKKNP